MTLVTLAARVTLAVAILLHGTQPAIAVMKRYDSWELAWLHCEFVWVALATEAYVIS